MKFSIAAIVGVLAAAVSAKPAFTNTAFDITAGEAFTLKWTNASGPVEIQLVNGPEGNLKPVGSPIATGESGTSFTWTPPSTLPSDTYAFEISDSTTDPNYSVQWKFVGSVSASSSASSTSSSTSASLTTSTSATTITKTSSSASSSTTSASNTTTSATTKSSSSATTSASRTATTVPTNTNNGQRFASPLGLVLLTFAALICFN